MRKILKYILGIMLCAFMLCGTFTNVYAASAELTGPGTVRAGDTITLSLKITDQGKYGLEGSFEYDSSVVTLSSVSCGLNGWKVEQNGNGFVLYDDALTNALNGTKTVLTLKFKVNSNVATGREIKISVKNMVATDGNSESNLGTATYSIKVAKPLSANANLSALVVEGANLSPSFSAGTISYDIGEVPFSTSELKLTYKTEDANAAVKVSGNTLSVGNNTVSVVVTAENGSKKTYTIKVKRAQDPNYQASSDATLSSISVSEGKLSPGYSKEVDTYVVYVSYEMIGEKFTATGKASDSKAAGVMDGVIDTLVEGSNITTIVATAEDGTTKEYTVIVYVMPRFDGSVPQIGAEQEEEPSTEEPSTEEPSTEEPSTDETPTEDKNTESENESQDKTISDDKDVQSDARNVERVIIVVLVVIIVVLSGVVVFLISKRQK